LRQLQHLLDDLILVVAARCEHGDDENQTTFSAAIETLARLGLGEPLATAILPVVLATLRSSVAAQFQRLAGLLSHAAIESATAARLAGATARLVIQDRAVARPKDFEDTIFTEDPDDPIDQRVKQAWEHLKTVARIASVKSLKAPLPDWAALEETLADAPGVAPEDANNDGDR
jgi:hypothetical protein